METESLYNFQCKKQIRRICLSLCRQACAAKWEIKKEETVPYTRDERYCTYFYEYIRFNIVIHM